MFLLIRKEWFIVCDIVAVNVTEIVVVVAKTDIVVMTHTDIVVMTQTDIVVMTQTDIIVDDVAITEIIIITKVVDVLTNT